jgi:hypothetical protein
MGDNPIKDAVEKVMEKKEGGSGPSRSAVTASGYLKWFVGGAAVFVTFVVAFVIGSATGWNAGRQAAVQLVDVAGLEQAACPIPGTQWGPEFHRCRQDPDAKAQCPPGNSWDNQVGKCVLNSATRVGSATPPPAQTPSAPQPGVTTPASTDPHCNLQGTVYVNGKCVFTPNTGQQPTSPAAPPTTLP